MRFTTSFVISLSLLGIAGGGLLGCTGPRGPAGSTGCTVTATDGGARIISCGDGTSVSVSNGAPGVKCTVTTAPAVAALDGGGRDGPPAASGDAATSADAGADAVAGASVTKIITCDDGTSATVTDGQPGTSCTVATTDAGVKTITCGDGTAVSITPEPPVPTAVLAPSANLPGLVVHIVSVAGGSGPSGSFQIGDTVAVTFTARTGAGVDLPLTAIDNAAIWIAGPTSHYQRVLPSGRDQLSLDVKALATRNLDGSYTYKFPSPLPAVYGPPLYDTTKFSLGELTGQGLEHGSYTLALRLFRSYTVGTVAYRDVGSQTSDFLVGTATALEPREVVTLGNCNSCHVTLQAHGGTYRDTKLCVTCHTAGAEDRNSTDTADATPVTIEFGTMVHRIHDGAHLPSVLGIGTNADGTRSYAATPVPYVIGGGTTPSDFSAVQFPVWPSLSFPTPRDQGYTALTATQKLAEDSTHQGVIACEKCHGDPDGAGPLAAPVQGDFAYTHESRQACGSCHDDIDWTKPYKRNTDTGMPAQTNDATCLVCHTASGFAVGGSPRDGHRHPLLDPTFNPGLHVALSNVHEAGASANGNGKLDIGEKIAVTLSVTNDSGAALAFADLPALSVVVTGPTSNRNLLLSATLPPAALAGTPPFNVNLPDAVNLELLGTSTATTGDVFTTARNPVWNVTGAAPTLYVRTAAGPATTLGAAAAALQNFVTVASSAGFLRNDYLVVDDGVAGAQEYLRVQWVDGSRVWFAAAGAAGYQPGLRVAHAAGASVTKVTLAAKTLGTDYTLAPATGTITEVTELGAGAAVLASYTTDFVVPAVYGPPLNDSPDLGEAAGKWKGLPLVPGTYTVGVWGSRTLTLARNGETNSYRSTSPAATVDFLVGAATTVTPVAIVSSGAACNNCHSDVYAHGGSRRGVDTCLLCHGSAGTEDRPRYVAASAPPTPGVTVEFRSMLHKIHSGSSLTNAATYSVVGFGATAYPNNFSVLDYADVEFPAMPDGVKDCAACHGTSAAWQSPADRSHPTAATVPARAWGVACGTCHDSSAAAAHVDIMTSTLGNESCATCHGAGRDQDTTLVHEIR